MTGSNSPLGLFGGRFDPVHRAHIKIAQAVADQLKLDEVRWIVTGSPVHKPTVASASHRLRMVELALADLCDPRMVADDREIIAAQTGHTNYSADTIASFKVQFPERKLVWILGEDQLEEFHSWSRWQWIVQQVTLAVCARPKTKISTVAEALKIDGADIQWINISPDSVSSTAIRDRIRSNESVNDLLPRSVADYVSDNRLY